MGVPTYMYRRKDGEVEARVFDSDEIPAGWADSPAKAHESTKRYRKVKHDDGK